MRQAQHRLLRILDRIAGAGVALIELVGQLAQRALDGANGFLGLGRGHVALDTLDALALLAQMAGQALQAFGLGVDQRFLMTNRVWVIKEPDRIFVVFARCTHLGCTPEWKPSENKFKCPCHGSGYDAEAINFEGPAPRPLERAKIYVDVADGQIVVDKSKQFHQERGEWTDPEAFIKL